METDIIQMICKRLDAIGHKFLGVTLSDDGLFIVYALDPSNAQKLYGPRPVKENCRDFLDYKNALKEWKTRGTYVLYADKDIETTLANALFRIPVPK